MKRVFEEWGGTIVSVISIVTLIAFVVFMMSSTGLLSGSFQDVVRKFVGASGELIDSAASGFVQGDSGSSEGAGGAGEVQLATPEISISGSVLTISPVANATKYQVYNGEEMLIETTSTAVDLSEYLSATGTYLVRVRALGANGEASGYAAEEYVVESVATYKFGDAVDQGDYRYVYLGCESYEEFEQNYLRLLLHSNALTNEGVPPILETEEDALEFFAQEFWNCSWEQAQADYGLTKEYIYIELLGISEEAYNLYNSSNGWQIVVADTSKTSYEAILDYDGIPVIRMDCTFENCSNMIVSPEIPNTVISMQATFKGCTALTTAPNIPTGVLDMWKIFMDCPNLKTYAGSSEAEGDFSGYVIPSSVIDMTCAFYGCESLKLAPTIPSSVTNIGQVFKNCSSLTGTVLIPCTVDDWEAIQGTSATIERYHYTGCGH